MVMPDRWKRQPKADPSVVEVVDELTKAAQAGQARVVFVVTINPNLEVECAHAGLTDMVRRRLISSALTEAALKVLNPDV